MTGRARLDDAVSGAYNTANLDGEIGKHMPSGLPPADDWRRTIECYFQTGRA